MTWEQFKFLIHEYSKISNRTETTGMPTIDIDANNVAMRIIQHPVNGIMDLAKAFVAADAQVCVVADNSIKRYNTKREGTSRKVKREKNRLLSIEYESRLTACLQGQEDELGKEDLAKKLARAQKEATNVLDPSFAATLQEKIELHDRTKSFMTMKIADAQADPLLADELSY